ncbi:MAG TPA: hypothetical protein VF763_04040 [Candidatus Limnocylindrales bacterium]
MPLLDQILVYLGGMGLAFVVFGFLVELRRAMSRRLAERRAVARRAAPPPWVCSRCHSANRPEADRCYRGCGPRAAVEQLPPEPAPMERRVDDGSLVTATLDEAAAHVAAAPFRGRTDLAVALSHDEARASAPDHWTIRVDGRIAARARDESVALAFLGDLAPDAPLFLDPEGAGFVRYRLTEVLAAFADPARLPPAYRCVAER